MKPRRPGTRACQAFLRLLSLALTVLITPPGVHAASPDLPRLSDQKRFRVEVAGKASEYYLLLRGQTPDACLQPVDMRLGVDGPVILQDCQRVARRAFFKVEAIPISSPRDTDGDGIDDVTELRNLPEMNPLNPARSIPPEDGMIYLPDRAAFDAISHRDNFPGAQKVREVKFLITNVDTDRPELYFLNLNKHLYHYYFAQAALGYPKSLSEFNGETYFTNLNRKQIAGSLVVHEAWRPPGNEEAGIIVMEFWPSDPVSQPFVQKAWDLVTRSMPGVATRMAYHPASETQRTLYKTERALYETALADRLHVISSEELTGDVAYSLLNPGVGYGRLILFDGATHLTPRDIPIFRTLPNDITRTAGIITAAPQTPLSHINLKARQNKTPNIFLRNADTDPRLTALLGKYVRFEALPDDFTIREARPEEVDEFLETLRPKQPQYPPADFSHTTIRPLSEIGFRHASAFGAKAANLAEMRKFLPAGMAPDGFAVPFYFYREYMRANGLDAEAAAMLADPAFQRDPAERAARLEDFRKRVRQGAAPDWMVAAVEELQAKFPRGQGIRCRSSTNNEDLEHFSGAGLYDSYTHHPHEGHLLKTLKQVWASLWNVRAFDERDFYRVDHLSACMGVLVTPNFEGEKANGVGVTKNIIDPNWPGFYINAQLGESLVTNPDPNAIPEEFLIADLTLSGLPQYEIQYVTFSNLVPEGERVLTRAQAEELAVNMQRIRNHFYLLYGGDYYSFAMEIEWKIDASGKLVIKQARPWID